MKKTLHTRGGMCLAAAVFAAVCLALLTAESAFGRNPPVTRPPVQTPPPPPPPPPPSPPQVENPPPPPQVETPPPIVVPPPPPPPPPTGGGTSPGGIQHLPEPATLLTGAIGSGLMGLYALIRRKTRASSE